MPQGFTPLPAAGEVSQTQAPMIGRTAGNPVIRSFEKPPMTDAQATRWCPLCRRATVNAPLPQLAEDSAHLATISPLDETRAFRRKLYCVECRSIWESLELPAATIEDLLAARDELEAAQRQIAMLRLLIAKERQAQEQTDRPALRLAG
jgi:hypothetical protein